VLDAGEDIPAAVHRVAESTVCGPENPTHSYRKSPMTDPRTPLYEGSAVVDDRTIQVASRFADLEIDARRQAGFRVWTQVLSGERHKREAPLARG
jgi:hypothetical protein